MHGIKDTNSICLLELQRLLTWISASVFLSFTLHSCSSWVFLNWRSRRAFSFWSYSFCTFSSSSNSSSMRAALSSALRVDSVAIFSFSTNVSLKSFAIWSLKSVKKYFYEFYHLPVCCESNMDFHWQNFEVIIKLPKIYLLVGFLLDILLQLRDLWPCDLKVSSSAVNSAFQGIQLKDIMHRHHEWKKEIPVFMIGWLFDIKPTTTNLILELHSLCFCLLVINSKFGWHPLCLWNLLFTFFVILYFIFQEILFLFNIFFPLSNFCFHSCQFLQFDFPYRLGSF